LAQIAVARENKERMVRSFAPEIEKLNIYVSELARSKRFVDKPGTPLYDPHFGWNPLYRITGKDLLTKIPLNPFEEIHAKADIPFGQPLTDPDDDTHSYMPFTWFQHNARIAVHPINYEIERAHAIRKIYQWVFDNFEKGWVKEDYWDEARKKASNWWR